VNVYARKQLRLTQTRSSAIAEEPRISGTFHWKLRHSTECIWLPINAQ